MCRLYFHPNFNLPLKALCKKSPSQNETVSTRLRSTDSVKWLMSCDPWLPDTVLQFILFLPSSDGRMFYLLFGVCLPFNYFAVLTRFVSQWHFTILFVAADPWLFGQTTRGHFYNKILKLQVSSNWPEIWCTNKK